MKIIPFLYTYYIVAIASVQAKPREVVFYFPLIYAQIDWLCRRATPHSDLIHTIAMRSFFVLLLFRENKQECNWWCVLFSHRFTHRYNQITLSPIQIICFCTPDDWICCRSFFVLFLFSPLTQQYVVVYIQVYMRVVAMMCTVTQRLCVYHILIEL